MAEKPAGSARHARRRASDASPALVLLQYIVVAYIAMAYIVTAYIVMVYVLVPDMIQYAVMAYIVMVYLVFARQAEGSVREVEGRLGQVWTACGIEMRPSTRFDSAIPSSPRPKWVGSIGRNYIGHNYIGHN